MQVSDLLFGATYSAVISCGTCVAAEDTFMCLTPAFAPGAVSQWLAMNNWLTLFGMSETIESWDGFVCRVTDMRGAVMLSVPVTGIDGDALMSTVALLAGGSGSDFQLPRRVHTSMMNDRESLLAAMHTHRELSVAISDDFMKKVFPVVHNRDRGIEAEKREVMRKGGRRVKGSGSGHEKGDYRDPGGIYMVEIKTQLVPSIDPGWLVKLCREAAAANLEPKLIMLSGSGRWEITVAKNQKSKTIPLSSLDMSNVKRAHIKIMNTVWIVTRK